MKIQLLALLSIWSLSACDQDLTSTSVNKRTMTVNSAKSSGDQIAGKPTVNGASGEVDDPNGGGGAAGVPNTQLEWDGSKFGETGVVYLVPME